MKKSVCRNCWAKATWNNCAGNWCMHYALTCPPDTPGLDEHLRETVAGQLAIDQPFYSALHPTA